MAAVKCPRCGKTTEYSPQNVFRPFCSERCRMIDLGKWANEEYRVPAPTPRDGGIAEDYRDDD